MQPQQPFDVPPTQPDPLVAPAQPQFTQPAMQQPQFAPPQQQVAPAQPAPQQPQYQAATAPVQQQYAPVQPQIAQAPQVNPNPKYYAASDIQDYKAVPLYRKRWFVILAMLLFVPAGIIIVLTGNVYAVHQKTQVVYTLGKSAKLAFILAGLVIVINNINILSR